MKFKKNKYIEELGEDFENYYLWDKKFKKQTNEDYKVEKLRSPFKPDKDGFVPAEFWNLDRTLCLIIYSYLRHFREHYTCGLHPVDFDNVEEWKKMLDLMANAFKYILTEEEGKEDLIEIGLKNFKKYFHCLWS